MFVWSLVCFGTDLIDHLLFQTWNVFNKQMPNIHIEYIFGWNEREIDRDKPWCLRCAFSGLTPQKCTLDGTCVYGQQDTFLAAKLWPRLMLHLARTVGSTMGWKSRGPIMLEMFFEGFPCLVKKFLQLSKSYFVKWLWTLPFHVNFPPPCAAVNSKLWDQSAEKTLVAEAMEDVGENTKAGLWCSPNHCFLIGMWPL